MGDVEVRSKIGKWILFNLTGYSKDGIDPRQELTDSWTDGSLDQFTVLRYTFVILSVRRFESYTSPEIASFANAVWSLMSLKGGLRQADIEAVVRNAISKKAGSPSSVSEESLINIYSACSKAMVVDAKLSFNCVADIVAKAEAGAISQGIDLIV